MNKINKLTPEQEYLIPAFQDKWRAITLSTQPIDSEKAKAAVKAFYTAMGKKEPEIRFFRSPNAIKLEALVQDTHQLAKQLGAPLLMRPLSLELLGQLQDKISAELWQDFQEKWQLSQESLQYSFPVMTAIMQQLGGELSQQEWDNLSQVQEQLREQELRYLWEQQQEQMREQFSKQPGGDLLLQLGDSLWNQLGEPLWKNVGEPIVNEIVNQPFIQEWEEEFKQLSTPWLQIVDGIGFGYSLLRPNIDVSYIDQIDFCISVLKCEHDEKNWSALQSLINDCGWFFPFEKTCIVCDRPTKLFFDAQSRLHAEGEAAIQFSDNYSLYAYQGVNLPEKYGRLHPNQWRAEWLLSEHNAELRRVLIQGIGYGRICQELKAIKLDSWREYTLLLISSNIDIEPIYLLKMTCPSTGHIHALRVPPNMRTAREAIHWANWGVDPENFSVAT
ncbi:MAG: hypothetical protein F6K10_41550 [Moorea sp. SIO2B7]|nr:hypothetical protein [Moorena sp. SIO2B7]